MGCINTANRKEYDQDGGAKRERIIVMVAVYLSLILMLGFPVKKGYGEEKFPNKPLTVIVPMGPGAGSDLSARVMLKQAEKALGQPVIVKNITGGTGTIGYNEAISAPADGYTLTLVSVSFVLAPYTVKGIKKYINRADPICLTAGSPAVLTVGGDTPWKTFKELIDFAKANPRKVRLSNSGHGGPYHIGATSLEAATGVKFTHMPYKGTAPGLMALLGGHVEGTISTLGVVLQYAKSGKLRILATFNPERYEEIPEVPTFKELGIHLDVSTWWGYVGPKGIPRKNINILAGAFKKGVESSEFRETAKQQLWVLNYLGPEAFAKYLADQDNEWHKALIQEGGINVVK